RVAGPADRGEPAGGPAGGEEVATAAAVGWGRSGRADAARVAQPGGATGPRPGWIRGRDRAVILPVVGPVIAPPAGCSDGHVRTLADNDARSRARVAGGARR